MEFLGIAILVVCLLAAFVVLDAIASVLKRPPWAIEHAAMHEDEDARSDASIEPALTRQRPAAIRERFAHRSGAGIDSQTTAFET